MSTRTALERAIAEVLEDARLDLGLSQEQVSARAQAAGYQLPQSQVSRVARGAIPLKIDDTEAFAAAVGMTLTSVVRLAEGEITRTAQGMDVRDFPGSEHGASGARRRRPRHVTGVTPEA